MPVEFGFKNEGDHLKNITVFPNEYIDSYYKARQFKIRFIIIFAILFVGAGIMLLNQFIGFMTAIPNDEIKYVLLFVTCGSLIGLIYMILWERPRAYLVYGCIAMDEFGKYVASSFTAMVSILKLSSTLVTPMSKKNKKDLLRTIDTAKRLMDMGLDFATEEYSFEECISIIQKNLPLYGFKVRVSENVEDLLQ